MPISAAKTESLSHVNIEKTNGPWELSYGLFIWQMGCSWINCDASLGCLGYLGVPCHGLVVLPPINTPPALCLGWISFWGPASPQRHVMKSCVHPEEQRDVLSYVCIYMCIYIYLQSFNQYVLASGDRTWLKDDMMMVSFLFAFSKYQERYF